jgi:DNA primase
VFLDGDRGGDLILRELIELAELDFVARAPTGREVEELSGKEVLKALRNKLPIEQVLKDLEITVSDKNKGKDKGKKVTRDKGKKEEPIVADVSDIAIAEKFEDTDVDVFELDESDKSLVDIESGSKKAIELPSEISELTSSLGSFEALFVTNDNKIAKKAAVKDLRGELSGLDPSKQPKIIGIVFDGIVTQRLIDLSKEKELQYVAGAKVAEMVKVPENLKIYAFEK